MAHSIVSPVVGAVTKVKFEYNLVNNFECICDRINN